MLRATTACTFSTSQLPKVVRTWCVLYIFTWKCASRHNGVHFWTSQLSKVLRRWCVLYILTWKRASRHNSVQFFFSHLPRWLRTCRFSEPTFQPSGATNLWKNTVSRTYIHLLSSDSFSSLSFFLLLFSDSSHLYFSICPYGRKFDF